MTYSSYSYSYNNYYYGSYYNSYDYNCYYNYDPYETYEFTAFSESSLNVGDLNCGDTFTMPDCADTTISVSDNDKFLSGDSKCNENSDDSKGQTASITTDGADAGNGGQIYAESYWWVYDQHGNWYVMVEIEQEGTNEDYFSFYTGQGYGLPPAGAELTVHSAGNVTSEWISFADLDAGEYDECACEDTCVVTVEAEDMHSYGFQVVHGNQASGGELVKLTSGEGKLTTNFEGKSGTYDLTIRAQDENDGVSKLKVYVNGVWQETIWLDRQSDGSGSNDGSFSDFTISGLEINQGDKVSIRAWSDGGEFVRIDSLTFENEDCGPPPPPPPPLVEDDLGKTCADDEFVIDVLANDDAGLTITEVDGQLISEGGPAITTSTGTLVKLVNGELVIDGEDAYAALDIGESDSEVITYTVADANGGVATANLTMTFCGDANSVDSFYSALPANAEYQVSYAVDGNSAPFPDFAYDVTIQNSGDARFDGVTFEAAYCIDYNTAVRTIGESSQLNVGDIFGAQSAAAASAYDPATISHANGLAASENADIVNWIIAQDFEDQGYSGWAVQFAIWEFTDNFDASSGNYSFFENTELADVEAIVSQALSQDGFEAQVGDTVGVIIDPGLSDADNIQPFIVALDWEQYDCLC